MRNVSTFNVRALVFINVNFCNRSWEIAIVDLKQVKWMTCTFEPTDSRNDRFLSGNL